MIPQSHIDLVSWETKALGNLATIGPGGAPNNNPVWFDWDGTHIGFSVLTTRQKYRNLLTDGRAAITVLDPDDQFRYIEIRGVLDETEPDVDIEFISRMSHKYTGHERYQGHKEGDERVVLKIRPTQVLVKG